MAATIGSEGSLVPQMQDPDLTGVVGLRVTTTARTVSPGECGVLSSLLWTRGPLHTDVMVAEASPFGALSLAGPVVVALAAGLWASSTLMPTLSERHGIRLFALLGTEARYRRPVLAGDTVHLEITVTGARRSRSTPTRAVLDLDERLVNQRGECAVEIDEHVLADIRPAP
jgi:acyl dehydratase